MLKSLQRLKSIYSRFGIGGVRLHNKIKSKQQKVLSFSHPQKLKQPVYLRTCSTDYAAFCEIILDKAYEFPIKFTPKVIIDCGANIGLTSLFFKTKYPDATLIAVEPEKNNFELLSKNLQGYNKTVMYNKGVWDKTANLKIEDPGFGNWGFIVHETNEPGENTVPAVSIADIMRQNNLEAIDILKIDIEGSEKEVFESGYEYWLPKTKLIVIELHDRLRKGASQSFFRAIAPYNFEIYIKGQNLFCFLN